MSDVCMSGHGADNMHVTSMQTISSADVLPSKYMLTRICIRRNGKIRTVCLFISYNYSLVSCHCYICTPPSNDMGLNIGCL